MGRDSSRFGMCDLRTLCSSDFNHIPHVSPQITHTSSRLVLKHQRARTQVPYFSSPFNFERMETLNPTRKCVWRKGPKQCVWYREGVYVVWRFENITSFSYFYTMSLKLQEYHSLIRQEDQMHTQLWRKLKHQRSNTGTNSTRKRTNRNWKDRIISKVKTETSSFVISCVLSFASTCEYRSHSYRARKNQYSNADSIVT